MSATVSPSYNAWADALLVEHLRTLERPPKVDLVLAHLAVAGETWLSRLEGDPPTPDLWPNLPFEESASRLAAVDARLLEPRDPYVRVSYRNSAGQRFENSVAEILGQLLNHAAYHRGEIGGLLLAEGKEPPITDFIAYLRL